MKWKWEWTNVRRAHCRYDSWAVEMQWLCIVWETQSHSYSACTILARSEQIPKVGSQSWCLHKAMDGQDTCTFIATAFCLLFSSEMSSCTYYTCAAIVLKFEIFKETTIANKNNFRSHFGNILVLRVSWPQLLSSLALDSPLVLNPRVVLSRVFRGARTLVTLL